MAELIASLREDYRDARMWSGSALVAGEKRPAAQRDEEMGRLYSWLCGIGNSLNYYAWALDAMNRRPPPASVTALVEALERIKEKGTRTHTVRVGDAYDPNGWQEITEVSEEAEIAASSLAAHRVQQEKGT